MKKNLIIVFWLAFAGFLFSGYLSLTKILSNACAFNEPCPYFLGYPACWYGFAMYLVMFAATGLALWRKFGKRSALRLDLVVSAVGVVFAGSFFVQEIVLSTFTGALGLSTCGYGLIFYILIFAFSLLGLRKSDWD